jgi:hypothetical protein
MKVKEPLEHVVILFICGSVIPCAHGRLCCKVIRSPIGDAAWPLHMAVSLWLTVLASTFLEAMPQVFRGAASDLVVKGRDGKAKPFRYVLRQSRSFDQLAAKPLTAQIFSD